MTVEPVIVWGPASSLPSGRQLLENVSPSWWLSTLPASSHLGPAAQAPACGKQHLKVVSHSSVTGRECAGLRLHGRPGGGCPDMDGLGNVVTGVGAALPPDGQAPPAIVTLG